MKLETLKDKGKLKHFRVPIELSFLFEDESRVWDALLLLQQFMLDKSGHAGQTRGMRFYPIKKCDGKDCRICRDK